MNAALLIVALAPLPFGSNRPWAWSLLALATGVLLIAHGWRQWRGGTPFGAGGPILGPALLFLAVCGFVALQTLPGMPPWLANPYWQLPADVLGVTPYNSISIDPSRTLTALMRLLTYGGIFWLALQGLRRVEQADRAMLTVALVAACYSAYGALMHLSGAELILWYPKWDHLDSVTATFPNRNHFATFAGLGLLCALAFIARQVRFAYRARGGMASFLLQPRASHFAAVAAVPTDLGGLVLSQSRAGLASTILACVVFLAGLALRARTRRRIWIALLLGFFAAAGLYFALGGGGTLARLALLFDPEEVEYRFPAYRMMLLAIADHPWVGYGYGTFEDAFKIYRAPPLEYRFDAGHSTYLENAIELGVPAALALVVSIAWLGAIGLVHFVRRRPMGTYGWAAACATLLVGLHAAVDFSLQIPAVAITFAVILAVGCGGPARRTVHHRPAHPATASRVETPGPTRAGTATDHFESAT